MAKIIKNLKSTKYAGLVYDAMIDFSEKGEGKVDMPLLPLCVYLNLKEKTIGWRYKERKHKELKLIGDFVHLD